MVQARAAMFARAGHLAEQERFDAALEVLRCLLLVDPVHHEARLLAGHVLIESGQWTEARRVYGSLAKAGPLVVAARAGLARLLFLEESWDEAWLAFAVRFALMDEPPRLMLNRADGSRHDVPPWDGQGRPDRLLVMAEQGLGDTLQFSRFLAPLAARCGEVLLAAPRRLHSLLRSLPVPVRLLAREEPGSLPLGTQWCPLLDLPRLLGLNPGDYHRPSPHLAAEPERVAVWANRLPPAKGRRIALCWRGNPAHGSDRTRSAKLADFAALAALPDVQLVVLQQGAADEVAACSFADRLVVPEGLDEGPHEGFADSAAIVALSDVVVSVDTALAHLAGALGRPLHLLLSRQASDWRWGYRRERPVWYPQAWIWRQKRQGDYTGAVADLAQALRA